MLFLSSLTVSNITENTAAKYIHILYIDILRELDSDKMDNKPACANDGDAIRSCFSSAEFDHRC